MIDETPACPLLLPFEEMRRARVLDAKQVLALRDAGVCAPGAREVDEYGNEEVCDIP